MPARGTQRHIYPGSQSVPAAAGPAGSSQGPGGLPGPRRARGAPRAQSAAGPRPSPQRGSPGPGGAGPARPGPARRLRLHTMARRKGSGPPLPQAPPRPAPPSRGRLTAPPARAALRPRRGLVPRQPRGRAGASRGRRRGPGGG